MIGRCAEHGGALCTAKRLRRMIIMIMKLIMIMLMMIMIMLMMIMMTY